MTPIEQSDIPEDLRRFVLTSVPSVPFVEALLVFRQHGDAPVTIDKVARLLYVGERQAAEVIGQLRAARVIEAVPDMGHRYAPAPDLAPMLETLAEFYRTRLVEITALIHSRTGRLAHQFADAFRLRKG